MDERNECRPVFRRCLAASLLGCCSCLVVALSTSEMRGQLPDLTINESALNPRLSWENISDTSCTVVEGCAQAGVRHLLRFTTESRNIGNADLVLGDPSTNPLFHFSPCHGHYHLDGFADYRLLNDSGQVAAGHKQGFCLLDSVRWDPNANPNRIYTCTYQGIQKGWADIYAYSLDCQWIDVTGVPAGLYILEVEVNPEGILPESDRTNNIASTIVEIDAGIPPPNDFCAFAIPVTEGTRTFSTLNATTDGPPEPGSCTYANNYFITNDIWFQYKASCSGKATVSLCGSSYDTKIGIYGGTCPTTTGTVKACNDDSCGFQSVVSFPTRKGEDFLIRIGGFSGATGNGILSISCTAKGGGKNK
jgi:lysyl oxidase